MVRVVAAALLCVSCATSSHEAQQSALTLALNQHHFAIALEQAQATLAAQTRWPASPFGVYAVKLEPHAQGKGHVVVPVTILTALSGDRPTNLATIELTADGDGVRAACTFEQRDANCSDWVWNALGADGLDEARAAANAVGEKVDATRREKEAKEAAQHLEVETRAQAAHEQAFVPAWVGSFYFGLAVGGNDTGAAAGVILRGGARRLHTPHLATAYLVEYQFVGQSARPGGGWASLVVPTFHVEMAFLTDYLSKPPMAYLLAGPVAVIDIDQAPGLGGGFRVGAGFRADYYFLEAYVQRVWTTGGTGGELTVLGAVGVGF